MVSAVGYSVLALPVMTAKQSIGSSVTIPSPHFDFLPMDAKCLMQLLAKVFCVHLNYIQKKIM